jgi:hypothetical protein
MNCFNWEDQTNTTFRQSWRSMTSRILITAVALLTLTGSAQAIVAPKAEPYSCQRLHDLERQCGAHYCDGQWLSDTRVECWHDQHSQQEFFGIM